MDLDELEGLDREVVLDTSEAKRAFVVKTRSGSYLRLTSSAFHLLRQLKEGRPLEEVARSMQQDPEAVRAAYARFSDKLRDATGKGGAIGAGFWLKRDVVPARWVVQASTLFAWAFHPWSALFLLLFTAFVAAMWRLGWAHPSLDPGGLDIPFAYGLYFASLAIHELGHASACKRFGASPSAIGVGLYLVFPVLYSDVSDAWTLPRRQRAVVGLGGVYLQSVVAAVYLALFMATGWSPFLLAVAGIMGTVAIALNPFFRFDGYWVVADLLGVSHLGREGRRVLRQGWERLRGRCPPPLPWPAWVLLAMSVHAILNLAAVAWILVRMGPPLLERLVSYPDVAIWFFHLVRDPASPVMGRDVATLADATFALLLGCVILWRLASGLAGGAIRRALARSAKAGAERGIASVDLRQ